MARLEVFDPPMCCATGVCGPAVDPALAQFASDLEKLKASGIEVARFNLSQAPAAFIENPAVAKAMLSNDDALPLLLLDGRIVAQGSYPDGEALLALLDLDGTASIYSEAVEELVAIGAAIAANCEPCFKVHFDKARKLGVSKEDMVRAAATAKMVKEAPARAVLEKAEKILGKKIEIQASAKCCCTEADTAEARPVDATASRCC
jgi:AhpD family alkylhydroperoxidase